MSQMMGQGKTSEKQLNKVVFKLLSMKEIDNLPEKEFRITIVKMVQELQKTMEKMQEMFTEDLEELKNKNRDE